MTVESPRWPSDTVTRTEVVVQGEFRTSGDPALVLSTVLGSCVAVCLYDDTIGIGGMNHYLLPSSDAATSAQMKYGTHAMELLINALARDGASPRRLKAKVFGGARIVDAFHDIGRNNAEFALAFLRREGFRLVASDLGGRSARRVHFHPATGAARALHTAVAEVAPPSSRPAATEIRGGGLELFLPPAAT